MNVLSVCSGIGAAELAFTRLGMSFVASSEIEAFPNAVRAVHFPDVPNWGDMTKFKEWPDADVDVLVGGTPCQSFSVAGLRKGLADPRGNLALTFLAIADRYTPRWILWENVPGVLSSGGGRDFGSFLGALAECGYGFAYRVLDAQYFGLAQRRKRVFVVGYLGDWRPAAAVLFERHGLQGHPAPRRGEGARVAALTSTGVGTCGADGNQAGHLIASTGNVPHCLNAGGMGRQDYETETLVAHSLRGEGFDASEDGRTGRGTPLVPVAFAQNQRNEVRTMDIAGALASEPGMKQQTYVTSPIIAVHGTQDPDVSIDMAHPLGRNSGQENAVCFSAKDHGADASDDLAPTLRAMGHADSHANGGGQLAVAFDLRGREGGAQFEGPHDTANIRAASGGSSRSYLLTPPENIAPNLETHYNSGHASTPKANTYPLLRELRKAVGEEAFAEWGLGVSHSLQSPEILRQKMHGGGIRRQANDGDELGDNAHARQEDRSAGPVLTLWQAGCAGRPPRGWKPSEQLAGELVAHLSELSHQGTSVARVMHDLWRASEGLGVLREALSTLQAAWRPDEGDREAPPDVCGVRCSSSQQGPLRQALHESEAARYAVRRLTPKEAERLQGFPDGYTAVPYRGKPAADGPRYKSLGNSMAVPCMRWLGMRIQLVERLLCSTAKAAE